MIPWRAILRPWRAWRRADDGAAAVELALFLPVLLLCLLGAVDFGRVVVAGIAVSNAVKAGVQYGAQSTAASTDTAEMRRRAEADFGTRYGTLRVGTVQRICRCPGSKTAVSCTALPCGAYGVPHEYVQMEARDTVSLFIRYPGFGAKITPTRTAILRVQ